MALLKLACWNVNGLRSIAKKGFFEWLNQENPHIVSLQETKITKEALSDRLSHLPGYWSYFSHANKKGYSGVAVYCRKKPLSVREGMGIEEFDQEGRLLTVEYEDFSLLNVYYPNGKSSEERLKYKLDFYNAFLKYIKALRKAKKRLIICGDFNTAHKPIDLARPKQNENISGFLPVERTWMDRFVSSGYIDTFREFNKQPQNYTWWHMRTRARERNVGWRIDYFFVSDDLRDNLWNAQIQSHVLGSDHCPITLELEP